MLSRSGIECVDGLSAQLARDVVGQREIVSIGED
jgi:hypothetical protein